jgi:carbonic anhydrase
VNQASGSTPYGFVGLLWTELIEVLGVCARCRSLRTTRKPGIDHDAMSTRAVCGIPPVLARTGTGFAAIGDISMTTVEITYRYGHRDVPARSHPRDAAAARLRLDDGNRAFAALLRDRSGATEAARHIIDVASDDFLLAAGGNGVPKQYPFAAMLGCSDARVPIELIFNEGPNDLFVVRVAGNGISGDVLGSLRYAMEHLRDSLRLVVVLGHSGCGAILTAVDIFLEPSGYLPLLANHALRGILDRQLIVVQATARRLTSVFGTDVTRHKRYREALIEASVVTNAALSAYTIQEELRGTGPHGMRAVYGVYLLESQTIWGPAGRTDGVTGLADPPENLASFLEFGERIVSSDRIASLISSE